MKDCHEEYKELQQQWKIETTNIECDPEHNSIYNLKFDDFNRQRINTCINYQSTSHKDMNGKSVGQIKLMKYKKIVNDVILVRDNINNNFLLFETLSGYLYSHIVSIL